MDDSPLRSFFAFRKKLKREIKKEFKKKKKKFKGSSGDPLLYLGTISVFLFLTVCFTSGAMSGSLSNAKEISLASMSQAYEETIEDGLFAGSEIKDWPESPELLFVESNSLKAATVPSTFSPSALGAIIGGGEIEETRGAIIEYVVESGDTLSSIASTFKISLNTLLWANDLSSRSIITTGKILVIPPDTGIIHHIKNGDTISGIAKIYKGKTDEIIAFNNLSNEADIYIGDIVFIPNGVKPPPTVKYAPSKNVPIANSYFICPIASPCRITQNLHWYNAIDFSHGKCGEIIYAAAAGTVQKVKLTSSTSKWAFGGAGNHITIMHPNGVVTHYGHIAKALVSPGQQVSQGQAIALMGGTPGTAGAGRSTGCHVHFAVSGARNPFAY